MFVFIFHDFLVRFHISPKRNVIDISIFRENLLAQYRPQKFVCGTTTRLLSHFGARWYTFTAQTSSKHFDAHAVFMLFRNLGSGQQNWTINFRHTQSTGPYAIKRTLWYGETILISVSGCSIFHKPWHVAPKGHIALRNVSPNERGPVEKMYLKLRHTHVQLAQWDLLAVSTLLLWITRKTYGGCTSTVQDSPGNKKET